MTLDDLIATDVVTGRALLSVPAFPVRFVLPCHARDFREMGRIRQWLLGPTTPGMTWRDGVFISRKWLDYRAGGEAWTRIVELVLHEIVHWWQLWRRMGENDYPATYGWQGLLSRIQNGSAHVHDGHLMEREANDVCVAILSAAWRAYAAAGYPAWFTFDTEPWLQEHYPATR